MPIAPDVVLGTDVKIFHPTLVNLYGCRIGDDTKIAASGLIMAILGGAVLTAVMGGVSDTWGIHAAFAVPLVCFLVIARYGLVAREASGASAR